MPAPRTPHIDVHVHMVSTRQDLGALLKKGALGDPALRIMADLRHSSRNWNAFLEQRFDDWYLNSLVARLRMSQHVDQAVLLAFDAVYKPDGRPDQANTLAVIPNEIVFQAARKYPELLPGASIHPCRPDALDQLERCAELGAVLIKWVPNTQLMDPGDERFVPFYEKMAALGLPLLTHTGYEHALKAPRQDFGDPRLLRLPLELGVTVIAAHAGASGVDDPVEFFPFFIDMLGQYPNLYGDLAALTWINRKKYLVDMVRDMPHTLDRMVHGTDYPVPVWPNFFREYLGARRTLALTASRNYFDVETEIKLAAGMPRSVLARAASVLRFNE
jgi:predicted TIM-barrel fold metal-dependent hydrolase